MCDWRDLFSVRSFSLNGIATKAFWGPAAQALGYPQGGGSGNSSYYPNPVTFTQVGQVTALGKGYALAYLGGGVSLIVSADGKVYRSTNGGVNWSLITTIAGFTPFQLTGAMFSAGGTTIVTTANLIHRSINQGTTWVTSNTGAVTAGGSILGTDNASRWVVAGNISNALSTIYSHSNNDGVIWFTALNVTPIFGAANPANIIWNGTQWIFSGSNVSSGNIQTSPDAVNWTITPGPALDLIGQIVLLGGTYYGCGFQSANLYSAASPIALATAPTITVMPASSGGLYCFVVANTKFFVFDFASHVYSSNSPTGPYVQGISNLPTGDSPSNAVYDPVNKFVILLGQSGVVTNLFVP
jgi:hypothetical protein